MEIELTLRLDKTGDECVRRFISVMAVPFSATRTLIRGMHSVISGMNCVIRGMSSVISLMRLPLGKRARLSARSHQVLISACGPGRHLPFPSSVAASPAGVGRAWVSSVAG